MGNQLLSSLDLSRHLVLNEVYEPVRMRPALELEVQPIVHLLNAQALLRCVMLNDQLLQEEEGSLVVHSLSQLSLAHPGVRSPSLLAVVALQIIHYELNHEVLLKECSIHNFLLHSELDLESPGVRFSVEESSVYQLDLLEALDMVETEREQLRGLKLAGLPGRAQVAVALSAVI